MAIEHIKYTKTHEWVDTAGDVFTVGITDHAQQLLGDLVYIELPNVGKEVHAGEECCVVESVKAASDVYAPISGKVVAINDAVQNNVALVNQSPEESGWLFKIQPAQSNEVNELLTASAYHDIIHEEH